MDALASFAACFDLGYAYGASTELLVLHGLPGFRLHIHD